MSGRKHSQLASIIICFFILFYAKNSHANFWFNPRFHLCKPSSCGKINIAYPFRLSSDPANCGIPRYELVCKHNATTFVYLVFDSKSKYRVEEIDYKSKYRVEEIDYKAKIFRVVDPGLIADNYSSMPLYSFPPPLHWYNYYGRWSLLHVVAFLNCDEPVNSTIYLDIGARVKGQYSYVLMGGVTVIDVANSCMVEKIVPIVQRHKRGVEDARNYSYKDVHNAMAHGFELDIPHEYAANFFIIMHGIFYNLVTVELDAHEDPLP